MHCKFSSCFCLYIQNGLNLFLLTANYMCWRKGKTVFFFSPVLYLSLHPEKRKKTDIKTPLTAFTL